MEIDIYNLTKDFKRKITDTTIIKAPNTEEYLLQQWNIKCNDKNKDGSIQNFNKTTKTNSPTEDSGATSLPPIGDSCMHLEASSNNHGFNVFVSFEQILFKLVI